MEQTFPTGDTEIRLNVAYAAYTVGQVKGTPLYCHVIGVVAVATACVYSLELRVLPALSVE